MEKCTENRSKVEACIISACCWFKARKKREKPQAYSPLPANSNIFTLGILVVRKPNPYRADDELIVVPQSLTSGLLAAVHLKLNHPTKSQLKKIWDTYFFSLNADEVIADCTTSCHLCNSFKRLPNELFEQSSSNVPQTVGLEFAVDVVRRSSQKILLARDIFSSFTTSLLIPDETGATLREGIIQTTVDLKQPSGVIIRVDDAPGFLILKSDQVLQQLGMTLDFGRCVNKNKNSNTDKAVYEFEKELKRLIPDGSPASASTIALAVANFNSCIRFNGMSSKEMLFRRHQPTGKDLNFPDNKVASQRKSMRENNHLTSALSKAKGGPPAAHINVNIGELVQLKLDGDKHSSRHFYLVADIDYSRNMATIQKFIGNQLRAKQYSVKLTEIYQATSQIFKQEHQTDESLIMKLILT